MARSIYGRLRESAQVARVIEVAIGGLRFHRSISENDPFGEIDVEDLYEVLRTLADRYTNLIAPFVGSWNQAIQAAEAANVSAEVRSVARALESEINSAIHHAGRYRGAVDLHGFAASLEDALAASAGGNSRAFDKAAQAVLRTLVYMAWIKDSAKVQYFAPLLRRASEKSLWIASLNYDNAIELAATTLGLQIQLGIEPERPTVSFSANSAISLAKLHGSVNWAYDTKTEQWKVLDQPASSPALIFGSRNKLRIEGPYLDLLFAFRSQLEQSESLEVCGYSFRDAHINHLLLNWLRRERKRRISIFDPHMTLYAVGKNIAKSFSDAYVTFHELLHERVTLSQVSASEWMASQSPV